MPCTEGHESGIPNFRRKAGWRYTQLKLLQSRLEDLRKRGYDASKARLKHEEETTNSKEYEIDIPVNAQAELKQTISLTSLKQVKTEFVML